MTQKRYTEIPNRQKCINKEHPFTGGAIDIFDDKLEKPQEQVNEEILNEIGADDTPDSIKGRVKNLETEVGSDDTPESIKGRIKTIEDEIGDDTTEESLSGRIKDLEEAVGDGGSVDERIAEEGAKHYLKTETYNKTELNSMITTPDQEYVTVTATDQTTDVTDVLPATGSADTVYRVGNWDGTQFDETVYSEYAWNGSAYVHLNTKEYGIDDEPTAGSNNLVKSGGVYPLAFKVNGIDNTFQDNFVQPYYVIQKETPFYKDVKCKIKLSTTNSGTIAIRTFNIVTHEVNNHVDIIYSGVVDGEIEVDFIPTNDAIYIGVCSYSAGTESFTLEVVSIGLQDKVHNTEKSIDTITKTVYGDSVEFDGSFVQGYYVVQFPYNFEVDKKYNIEIQTSETSAIYLRTYNTITHEVNNHVEVIYSGSIENSKTIDFTPSTAASYIGICCKNNGTNTFSIAISYKGVEEIITNYDLYKKITDCWENRNIVFYGDSITASNWTSVRPHPFGNPMWASLVAAYFNINISYGRGVGSTGYKWQDSYVVYTDANGLKTSQIESSYANAPATDAHGGTKHRSAFCSWDRITAMIPQSIKDTIDAIVVMGGHNDSFDDSDVSFITGNQTDPEWANSEYNVLGGDYDLTTLKGGIMSVIMKMQAWMPSCKIIIATPIGGHSVPVNSNDSPIIADSLLEISRTEKDIAERMSIPVIDMYATTGINCLNRSTYLSDGTHPYTLAGTKMVANAMIQGLRNLVPNYTDIENDYNSRNI